ncbi:outer membrane beta-barrel protein [Spirosoma fluviale]|uniref:Outer membrane protein beta-barrel domain-containing protein n=1 Tax=Spirosoma fluviale TaxID=1597977 RepID=A0A286GCD8_9BACT|nr:outer membrane beta-barrel protein [Spirosoma fluviale]SOD93195.1 Outer membrane protein beta-barrel domain-containing protein [Spirosoma fluviale]
MYTNRFLLLFFVLISPLLSQAQSDKPVGGHFGVKVGASFTQVAISGTSVNIPKRALQPNLGVMYRYRYHRVVVQPEALLAIKGGTFQQEGVGGRTTTSQSYYYACLPILFGYIPTEGLTVQAGPELSYALNSGSANGPGAQNDLGAVVGVHYDFLDMLNKFSLHVRYVHGFVNVSSEAGASYYNRNVQVSIVYNLFPKKKKK